MRMNDTKRGREFIFGTKTPNVYVCATISHGNGRYTLSSSKLTIEGGMRTCEYGLLTEIPKRTQLLMGARFSRKTIDMLSRETRVITAEAEKCAEREGLTLDDAM